MNRCIRIAHRYIYRKASDTVLERDVELCLRMEDLQAVLDIRDTDMLRCAQRCEVDRDAVILYREHQRAMVNAGVRPYGDRPSIRIHTVFHRIFDEWLNQKTRDFDVAGIFCTAAYVAYTLIEAQLHEIAVFCAELKLLGNGGHFLIAAGIAEDVRQL